MDEKRASTIILLETKGGKRKKNPLELAEACNFFVERFQSHNKASEYIKNRYRYSISDRMLRKLTSLLRLPEEVQQLLLMGDMGIDVAAQLSESKLDDETKVKVCKVVAGMLAHDAREVIQYATKFPNAIIEEYKSRVLAAKPKTEEMFVAIIPLNEEDYQKLKKESKKQKISLHMLCGNIIHEWLKTKEKEI